MGSEPISVGRVLGIIGGICAALVAAVLVIVAIIAGVSAFGRYQARANAKNQVTLTKIQAQNQAQYAVVIRAHNAVVQQQAYQRYLEAVGIRRAQDEISKTLTPLYIQHEAIQAEQAIAASGRNNTVVYVPSGSQGVPLVTAQAATGK